MDKEEKKTAESAPQAQEPAPGQPAEATEPVIEKQDGEEQPTPEQWREALEKAVGQRDEYLAMAQRTQAEFMNFKKRNAQVRVEAFDDGVRDALSKLLPTIDNLERAIDAAEKQNQSGALLDGVRMTLSGMLSAAKELGMEEIPALGEKFDPSRHNAVMRASEGEPGVVLEVFQKGYRLKDRVIRYAMVKVAAE